MPCVSAIDSIAMGMPCLFLNDGVGRNRENPEVIFSAKTILRMAKVSGYGNMKEGSVPTDSVQGWISGKLHTDEIVRGKAGDSFLQQFLVNRNVSTGSKSRLEGLHGSLFLLHEELKANLF